MILKNQKSPFSDYYAEDFLGGYFDTMPLDAFLLLLSLSRRLSILKVAYPAGCTNVENLTGMCLEASDTDLILKACPHICRLKVKLMKIVSCKFQHIF